MNSFDSNTLDAWSNSLERDRVIAQPALEFVAGSHRTRELVLAEVKVNSHEKREVSKEVKIKRHKDTSRHDDEEEMGFTKPSEIQRTTTTTALDTCGYVNNSADTRTSSRFYTGISVQHARTKSGVRLAITLQSAEQAAKGAVSLLTAELKRYSRLHEIKSRPDIDSDWFDLHLDDTKAMIRDTGDKNLCLGRIHDRGVRSSWYQDCFVVGVMSDDKIVKVIMNLDGEEYEIDLDLELSDRQRANYLTGGIWGHLKQSRSVAPQLRSAPSVTFGG
jgi:hypothetical protein